MRTSDSIKNIAVALLEAQQEMTHPKKTARNPHLRNHFADLPNVIDTVKAVLNKHGVLVVQAVGGLTDTDQPSGARQTVKVSTVLIHAVSGEWIRDEVEQFVDSQKGLTLSQCIGSAITYLRRYSLSSMACVASEPDDDGNESQDTIAKPNPVDDFEL